MSVRGYHLECVDDFNARHRGNTPDGFKPHIEHPQRKPVGREVWCTACGRMLDDRHWNANECRWACWWYAGDGMDEHLAAFLRVGPFARPFDPARDYERTPMEGYVQTGPTSYERIERDIDTRAVHVRLWRATVKYVKKHGW